MVLEVVDDVVVLSEPVEVDGVALLDELVEEEEVTPVAGEPAKELPGLFKELAPHPTNQTTATASTVVLATDVSRQ